MEILNTYKVIDIPDWMNLFSTLLIAGIIVFGYVSVSRLFDRKYKNGILCLVLAIACLVGVLWLEDCCERNYAKERYEVKIDSSMTAQELIENWNIIKTRGEILVIERKRSNEN